MASHTHQWRQYTSPQKIKIQKFSAKDWKSLDRFIATNLSIFWTEEMAGLQVIHYEVSEHCKKDPWRLNDNSIIK